MDKKYIFHSSCFDKELMRKQLIILNENAIDYTTVDKSSLAQFRAPLSGHFEVEIYISETHFDKASKLLLGLIE